MARAAGAADAVDVRHRVVRGLVVDDVGDVVDVDAAGCDVGGHEDLDRAVAEGTQGLLAGRLPHVAVDGADGETAARQLLGDLRSGALRAGEDDRPAAALRLQDAGGHGGLVHAVRHEHDLLRGGVGLGGADVLGPDVHRLGEEAAGQGDDRPRHRRGEQHRLVRVGERREDLLDVRQETQVEHLVGLVEHQDGHLVQLQVTALVEVDETARGAYDHVDALLQGLDLLLVGAAAVDRGQPHRQLRRGARQILADLHRQLAGGHDHQGARGAVELLHVRGVEDPVQQRHTETEGLAHAGAGLADEIRAVERQRERQLLDGEGAGDALRGQGLTDLHRHTQFSESRGGGPGAGGRGRCGHNLDTNVPGL